jgi:hypothetical protein
MNFPKKLEEASESELRDWLNRDPNFAYLASDELSRRYSERSNKSNEKFSRIIGVFTIIQIALAFFQFLFEVNNSNNKLLGICFLGIILISAFIMMIKLKIEN